MAAGEAPCHRTSDSHMPLIEDDSAPRAAEEAENRRRGPQQRGAEAGCQPHRSDTDRRRGRTAGAVGCGVALHAAPARVPCGRGRGGGAEGAVQRQLEGAVVVHLVDADEGCHIATHGAILGTKADDACCNGAMEPHVWLNARRGAERVGLGEDVFHAGISAKAVTS
jgi:hypothetical protein